MTSGFSKSQIALAVATALTATTMSTATADNDRGRRSEGTYVTGDFHNHTTCSDGSISMQKLVKKATDTVDTPWGLDWFVQSGHGGSGNRNCTLVEDASLATPAYPLVTATDGTVKGPTTTWQNSLPPVQPKGLVSGTAPSQNMWRWQSIQEFQYPVLEYLAAAKHLPLFIGSENNSAGHEHVSMSIISNQMPKSIFSTRLPNGPGYNAIGNANPLAHWEYCFDRNDTDTSRGNTAVGSGIGNNWDCSVKGSLNDADPSWNATAQKLIPAGGTGTGILGHAKTIESMKWLKQYESKTSYYVPAHLERAGPFNPNGNNGYNIEHLRDFNNAAPTVAFGMETQPGHGASDARGEYTIRRNNISGVNVDSVGGTTYGGVGVYGAQIGGVWDALLGEGRNFWYFTSSDWHNRGIFGPDDRRSTQDFFPGEYQRDFVMVRSDKNRHNDWDRHDDRKKRNDVLTPASVVDGLRTGNSFTSSGQLIDRLAFVACVSSGSSRPTPVRDAIEKTLVETAAIVAATKNTDVDFDPKCATMGEKLEVRPGQDVVVSIVVRDPSGKNYSPYSFANPSLLQVGIKRPINSPLLDHVDVVRGLVAGYRKPGTPDYSGQWPSDWISNPNLANVPEGAKNTSAAVYRAYSADTWSTVHGDKQYKKMTFRISGVKASQYLRLRGTNIPASVDYETDANGNPLADLATNAGAVNPTVPGGADGQPAGANLRIPCTTVGTTEFDGCPSHLATVNGQKYSSYDVAAWSDLWFYSNPIFIEVKGSTLVAGVK